VIENYFFRGMRFEWAGYGELMLKDDGLVENNTVVPPQLMTYKGVDMDLCTGPSLQHRQRALGAGLRLGTVIDFTWLLYRPGRTVTTPLAGKDVLTGYMSGCPIATYNSGGMKVAHVGTVANNPIVNAKVKQNFKAVLDPAAKGFNPNAAWPDRTTFKNQLKMPATPPVVALVTSSGKFFSLLLGSYPMERNHWVVGGILPCPAWDKAQLETFLG
jgi:hypothetical protein